MIGRRKSVPRLAAIALHDFERGADQHERREGIAPPSNVSISRAQGSLCPMALTMALIRLD